MAGKRRATSDLNHDNWNQEEEPEDSGTFKRASQDELKRRIIKTAKRRKPVPEDDSKKNAFANFTALSNVSAPSPTAFSFLSKLSGGVSNENPKDRKTSHELEENKDGCKNKVSGNELLESSNNKVIREIGDKESTNVNNGEDPDEIKKIVGNSSDIVDGSTNIEISEDTDERAEGTSNIAGKLEEFMTRKNTDNDEVVSLGSILSEKLAGEEVYENSEKEVISKQ